MTLSLNLNFKGTFCVKIVKQGPRGFICKSDIFHESYCLQSHEYKTYAWPGDGRWRQVIRRWVHHALCSHNFHFHNQTLSMISNVCSQTVGLQNVCQIVHELIFFIAFSTSASGAPLLPRLVSPVCVTGGWWWALIHNQLSSFIFALFLSPRTPPSQRSIILSIIF